MPLRKRDFSAFSGKRVLLLQGPLGPFFRRLSKDLTWAGAKVCKVNFNGGDCLFYPWGALLFRGSITDWPVYIEKLLSELEIDVVLLFGDCRPIHRVAHQVAQKMGIEVGVFEEGYVRPDYITFEWHGVNANSLMPRNPLFYLNREMVEITEMDRVGNTYWYAFLWAQLYYFISILAKPVFRKYAHHRPLNVMEFMRGCLSYYRKIKYRIKERGIYAKLTGEVSKRFYLMPLQVYNDAQISFHSSFESVEQFIDECIRSFAENAPINTLLAIKHHPLDRGYNNYSAHIKRVAKKHGVWNRVEYIHDQHLPGLLQHARGVVLINSTVGISSLFHGVPTKVCGKAVYDMQGLTFQAPLDNFWRRAKHFKLNTKLFNHFKNYLIVHSQVNGNFYRRLYTPGVIAGLKWPHRYDGQHVHSTGEESVQIVDEHVRTGQGASAK